MDLFKALSPVIPVFFLVVVGFIFANWKKISLVSVTEIIVYLCAPCLVFTALATKPGSLSVGRSLSSEQPSSTVLLATYGFEERTWRPESQGRGV
jgi:predicted permease